MKKTTFFAVALASLLLNTSCVDNNYDLSDIDTNSRFNVSGLTVPVNMDPVKLDLMLDIADDSDIKTDASGNYYFMKEGTFSSNPVNVAKIKLTKPLVDFDGKVSVSISLDADVKAKMQQYAGNMTIGEILANPTIMDLIGIKPTDKILDINFNSASASNEIDLSANGIDKSVRSIETLGIDPVQLAIKVKINGISKVLDPFAINNLKLIMPKGFNVDTKAGTTYNPAEGVLTADGGKYNLDKNYVADLSLTVKGINYSQFEEPGMKVFDAASHTFAYKKSCSASGSATLTFADLKESATYTDIVALEKANAVTYECNIGFDKDLVINSFKGGITYSMDDIMVDPVTISNVPDMLKENGTNIDLTNPQIYLSMNNHLNEYGISVNTELEIKGNNTITAPFSIGSTPQTNIVLSPLATDLYHAQGYTHQEVKTLTTIVGSQEGQSFPEILNIRVLEPKVPETALAKSLELGKDIEGVDGKWEFCTRLSLTDKTKIKYTKEWDDWGDEDLNGLTINNAKVSVTLQKDIMLDAESIEFVLMGRKGQLSGQTSLTGDASQDIVIDLTGTPVSEIQGGKLNVRLKGRNEGLNKNQEIKISNLKVVVDGYYDRKL